MGGVISSLQNPRIKAAAKLRDRRGRDAQSRLVIDGVREIKMAASAGLRWSEVFLCGSNESSEPQLLANQLESAGAEIVRAAPQVFAKVAFGNRDEGIVAVAHTPRRTLGEFTVPPDSVIAVLEGIEKPGNVGAILRSADAAGIAGVLLVDSPADLFNPNTIRASQGAVFTLPVAVATAEEALAWLRERNFRIVAARVDATQYHFHSDLSQPCAIVLGSEAHGLTERWQGGDVTPVALPMSGSTDSLNVSVTAGVLFYEALRQASSEDDL